MNQQMPPVALVFLAAQLIPSDAWAHAFGQRYDLPLPLSLYLWSAGFAVALSFIIALLFMRIVPTGRGRWLCDFSHSMPARWLTATPVRRLLQVFSLFLFVLLLVAGLFAGQDPARNFAPIFVWVIWWVGLAYIAAFLGNLWDLVNPWRLMFSALTWMLPDLGKPLRAYPQWLGSWPAVFLFFSFAWLEFISGFSQQPASLAWLVMVYSVITITGMRLFGLDVWLRNGEAFNVAFGLMARFGLFRGDGRILQIRLPGVGLLSTQPVSLSMMAFTLLMLTTVSFDGFIETSLWVSLNGEIHQSLMTHTWIAASLAPTTVQQWILTLALVFFYLSFIGIYLGFSMLACRLSTTETDVMQTAQAYVLSLVPIAIAYHLAHYLSYLLIAGQLIIPVISDPLGLGWNLFGSAAYRVDISVIEAADVWYLSVYAIVVGHISAVCIAHATALQREASARQAALSQLPMLVLMIAYTMISLWILSQPIIA